MSELIYSPGPQPRTVVTPDRLVLAVPANWEHLPPGDATLTRRVKQAGEHWTLVEWIRRKAYKRGIYAPSATIARIRAELVAERATESYAKQRKAAAKRREKEQSEYVEDFTAAVLAFLDFHPDHAELAEKLAIAVAQHATPIGSGTVARTERIPIERRAEAAVIAWMRHNTTDYDSLQIRRQKGLRREVRRELAQDSKLLLKDYRRGDVIEDCPLKRALGME